MSCQIPSCVPGTIDAGTTVIFQLLDVCHPANLWNGVIVFNANTGAAPTSVSMTANGDGRQFNVTISATVSAAMAQGVTTAIPIFTKIADTSVIEYGRAQTTRVLPSISAAAVPSQAQIMVNTLMAALAKLAGTTNQSVSFNGQSFSKGNLQIYRDQLVYWQARVIQEQEALTGARGGIVNDGRVQTEFVGPCGQFPFATPGAYQFPFLP